MRPTRRAGLTLLEVVIVTAIVAVLAIFLAGTIVTSTTMNRDTYIENEIVDLANRAADDMAGALAGAGRFTDCWDISNVLAGGIVAGDVLEFQDVRTDASGNKIYGARTVRRASDPNAFSDQDLDRLIAAFQLFHDAAGEIDRPDLAGVGNPFLTQRSRQQQLIPLGIEGDRGAVGFRLRQGFAGGNKVLPACFREPIDSVTAAISLFIGPGDDTGRRADEIGSVFAAGEGIFTNQLFMLPSAADWIIEMCVGVADINQSL